MLKKFYVRNLHIFSLLFLSVLVGNQAFGQDFSDYNWYFGNSVDGIIFNKFNDEPFVVNDQVIPFGNGGSAVATDASNGQLLFYTDGLNIYDATHNLMLNGGGILGNNSINQPAAICPIPNDQGKYYVFSNSGGANGVNFSIVDVNLPGNAGANQPNLGEVIGAKNINVLTNTAEAMVIARGNAMDQFWLIVQNTGPNPNEISVYNISDFTSTMAPPAPVSTLNLPNDFEAANFSFSDANNKIAVSPKDDNRNITILDLDPATGALSLDTEILNSLVNDGGTEAIYDTEWSPDGTKLFISRHGNLASPGATGDLYQFDLNNPGNTLTSQISGPIYRSFGLKLGPDNRIYHLFQTSQFDPGVSVGRINFPDSTAQDSTGIGYQAALLSNPQFNSQQFPEFSYPEEKMLSPISFEDFGNCATIPTMFYPDFDDEPQPTNFIWDFGVPGTGAENYIAPIITYDMGGSYNVNLTIEAGGASEMYSETVVINDNMLTVDLGQDTTVCRGQDYTFEVMTEGATGALTYTWSDGTTGEMKTLTNIGGATSPADSAGTYWVVVTDAATGCTAYDAIEISIYMDEQQKTNVWYFGNNAGIDFNQQPAVPLSDGAQNAPEGVATISDANGELIFYTDGETVYNKQHNVMSNGDNIGGDPGSSQSAVIAAFPGDETQYYIFTTDENFGDGTYNMRYSVVDLKLDPPFGQVTAKGKPLFTRSTEKITGTAPGGNVWIIGHEFGNNTFRAYPIDTLGIRQPVLSAIGSVHNNAAAVNGQGYMKLGAAESKLVVTVPGGPNIVEIFDFDQTTGEVSNLISVDLMEPTGTVYGVEFSPGGNKLFVTINGGGSSIFKEYALDSLRTMATELQSETISASLGAIQTAPDGNIYVAVDGASSLASISVSEVDTIQSVFQLDGFMLAGGTTSTLGLPNFIQQIPPQAQSPAITAGNGCVDQEIMFSGTGRSVIDQFEWDFGDGSPTSTDMMATHTYTAPGSYDVTLTLSNECDADLVLFQTVEVFDTPTTLGTRAEGFCPINDVTLNISATDPDPTGLLVYSWTNIQGNQLGTNNVLAVTQPGEYIATVSNENGCTETDTIQVVDVSPAVNLGLDQTICQNDVVPDLNALNPSATKTWFINGVAQTETGSTITVDTSVPGTFEYVVNVEDALSGCPARDTIAFTINPQPDLVTTAMPSTCNLMTGSLSVDIQNFDPAINYTFNVTGPSNSSGPVTGNPVVINGLGAGNYNVEVTNSLTGCMGSDVNVSIQDDLVFNIVGISQGSVTQEFCEGNGSVVIEIDAPVFPVTWEVFDGTGTNITSTLPGGGGPSNDEGGNTFTIGGLSEGDFTFQITDNAGCIQSGIFSLMSTPVDFTIDGDPDYCFDPNDPTSTAPQLVLRDAGGNVLNASSNDFDIVWNSNTGTFTDPTTQNPTTSTVGINAIGSHYYAATVTPLVIGANECATTDSLLVTIQEPPLVEIIVNGDPCSGQVELVANVTNALPGEVFTYAWQFSYPPVQNINVSYLEGIGVRNHQVVVGSNLRTCTGDTNLDVEVFEPIQIQIDPFQACDDGQPVPITASITPAGVSTVWTFNGGTIATDELTIDALDEGQYTVTASLNGCQSEQVFVVSRDPFTDANLPETAIICPADPDPALNMVEFDPGGDFVDFQWLFNGVTTTGTPTFVASEEGVLEASLTNPFGCVDLVTVNVVEDCVPRLSVPNAFRPNSTISGNETWKVFSNFVTELDVFVYNRWGELIYHSDEIDFAWDGTVNGEPAPGGTYAYLIKYSSEFDRSERVYEQRGGVVIVR